MSTFKRAKRVRLRSIIVILVFSVLIASFPSYAIAQEIQTALLEKTGTENEVLLEEIVEKRTEYSKSYLQNDGTVKQIVSLTPIHYYNEELGVYQDIDNSLSLTDGEYKNADNSFKVSLPTSLDGGGVTVSEDGYSVSFTLVNGKGKAKIADKKANKNKTAIEKTFKKSKSEKITYNKAASNTDIEYMLHSASLKESIIIKKKPSKDITYTYSIKHSGLDAILNSDGSISFTSEGEEIFNMPAPFMIDANGDSTTKVSVTLSNGLLTLTPDMDWLCENGREYPVILDPTISSSRVASGIVGDTFVTTESNTMNNELDYIKSGPETINQKEQTHTGMLWVVPPSINADSIVTNARLVLTLKEGSGTAELWKNTSSWETYSVTHANMPSCAQNMSACSSDGTFDITSDIMEYFATGENFGYRIISSELISFYSCDAQDETLRPYIELTYKDHSGNAVGVSNRDIDIGRAGIASVNDLTGNMFLMREDIATDGNIMPVSVSMIYKVSEKDSTENHYGNGFTTNYSQTIKYYEKTSTQSAYFKYRTQDGHAIYFEEGQEEENTVYKDPLESGYTFSISGTELTDYTKVCITDANGQKYYFDSLGRLKKICQNSPLTKSVTSESASPENGVISLTYVTDSNAIDSITDGVGRIYDFVYTNSLLSSITYYGSGETALKTVSYTYDDFGNQIGATYADSLSVQYTYTDKAMTSATNTEGYKIEFAYQSQSNKISGIKEFCNTATATQDVGYTYGIRYTKITDNISGKYLVMRFDNDGNMAFSYDEKGAASVGVYSTDDGENNARNTVLGYYDSEPVSQNLINDRTEYSFTGNMDYNFDINPIDMLGNTFGIVNTESGTGTLEIIPKNVPELNRIGVFEAGKTYTFVAYVKTQDIVGDGLTLTLNAQNGAAVTEISSSPAVTGTYNEQDKYLRLFKTFTVNAVTDIYSDISLGIALTNSVGTADIYTIALFEEGNALYLNMLANYDFESSTTPSGWFTGSGRNYLPDEEKAPGGKNKYISFNHSENMPDPYQQIYIGNGKEGDEYVMSGWARAYILSQYSDRKFGLCARFVDIDGNQVGEDIIASFNNDIRTWQYTAMSFTAPGAYDSIKLILYYDGQGYSANYDNIMLAKVPTDTDAVYKDDGTFLAEYDSFAVEAAEEETQEVSLEDPSTSRSKTTEDDYDRQIESVSAEGVGTTYNYDTNNNLLVSRTTDGRTSIRTDYTYSENGNYLSGVSGDGTSQSYFYNQNKGTLTYVADALGNRIEYGYNTLGRLTNIYRRATGGTRVPAATVTYTNEGNISGLSVNGASSYGYTYTDFGAVSSLKFGTEEAYRYEYNGAQDGYTLRSKTYPSTQILSYEYNDQRKLTDVIFGGVSVYEFKYGNYGNLIATDDNDSNIRSQESVLADGTVLYTRVGINGNNFSHNYYYTENGKYSDFIETIGTFTGTTSTLVDKDGRSIGAKWQSGDNTVNYEQYYDGLGRKSTATVYTDGKNIINTEYLYDSPKGYETTSLVKGINLKGDGNLSLFIEYEYDERGNIIRQGNTVYHYDAQNRISRCDDPQANTTTVYNYAAYGGNIASVVTYPYTEEETITETALSTDTYTYTGTASRLSSFNGQSIVYEGYTNSTFPTGYINGLSLSWKQGNRLATASKTDMSASYTYNDKGIRTSKTVNGIKTVYTLNESSITSQTVGDTLWYFRYEADGAIIGFEKSGEEYYYLKNLLGDIIGIVDADGNVVVSYNYDPWGKVISITGSHADTIGAENPFRYRGYYYDTETGFYYLQSRYYDPQVKRFISSDDDTIAMSFDFYGDPFQFNTFAYCNDNPVMYVDPEGNIAITTCIIIGAVAGMIIGGTAGAGISYAKYKKVKWKYVLIGAGVGAAVGAAAGYAIGIAIGASSTTIFAAKGFAKSFKITAKILKQMSRRGWSKSLIKDTILKNVGRKAVNKATGNAATAYFTSTGAYVVIDNITKEIIQISNRFDPNWVVDVTIKLLKSDVFVR